jgi:hypothetical protein
VRRFCRSEHPISALHSRPSTSRSKKWDGSVVAEWLYPKNNFIGRSLSTAWASVHRGYFNGYAMWTYLNTP